MEPSSSRFPVIQSPDVYNLKQTSEFISQESSHELTVYLIFYLETKKINPDILLNAVILIFSQDIDLLYLALAIRFGANVNKFVETSRGKFHPLATLGLNLEELDINPLLFAQAVSMLIVSDSDINSKASFLEINDSIFLNTQ